jgi:archaemetzincin
MLGIVSQTVERRVHVPCSREEDIRLSLRQMFQSFSAVLGCGLLLMPSLAPAEEPLNPAVTLCLQPLGDYDKSMLKASAKGVEYVYGFQVEIRPALKMPKQAWYSPRKRYRAEILLDYLRDDVLPRTACTFIVGFTSHDISTTKDEHKDWGILGLGEVGGVAAVVSSKRTHKRLKKPHTAIRRTVKVVNHEIGHVMGLPHVKGEGCLMNDAEGTVGTVDLENGLLCQPTIDFIEKHRGYRMPKLGKFDWEHVEP